MSPWPLRVPPACRAFLKVLYDLLADHRQGDVVDVVVPEAVDDPVEPAHARLVAAGEPLALGTASSPSLLRDLAEAVARRAVPHGLPLAIL